MKKSSQTVNSKLESDVYLTAAQEAVLNKKYLTAKKEIDEGRGFIVHNAAEFLEQLNKHEY